MPEEKAPQIAVLARNGGWLRLWHTQGLHEGDFQTDESSRLVKDAMSPMRGGQSQLFRAGAYVRCSQEQVSDDFSNSELYIMILISGVYV